MSRSLQTRSGLLNFPLVVPCTTWRYPLDALIRPYLPRMAQAVMTSPYHADGLNPTNKPRCPLMIDSGGAALLLAKGATPFYGLPEGCAGIDVPQDEEESDRLTPQSVLAFQEQMADVAFTLDLPCPPDLDGEEAERRLTASVANARWALRNRRRRDLPLYAVIPAWREESVFGLVAELAKENFDGIAIGGLIPRLKNWEEVEAIVESARQAAQDKPLHVLGVGSPVLVEKLFALGVDSVDSSSYVRAAADGIVWGQHGSRFNTVADPSPHDRRDMALLNLAQVTGASLPLSTFHSFNIRR